MRSAKKIGFIMERSIHQEDKYDEPNKTSSEIRDLEWIANMSRRDLNIEKAEAVLVAIASFIDKKLIEQEDIEAELQLVRAFEEKIKASHSELKNQHGLAN